MSSISVNRLTNANVYMDGNSLLGRAEEVSLPNIMFTMAEHKALGMVGKVEFFAGIEKMEMKIKWNAMYPEVMKKVANPFDSQKLQVRSSLENYTDAGRTSEKPCICYVTAVPKGIPMGNFKQHDNVEMETTYSVTYCKLEIDNGSIVEYDVLANIFKVDGVDVMAQYRANLGI